MKQAKKKQTNRQVGQAVVEFALVISLLIMIIFGIIEWGRLWMTMNVISGAAREGVRIAAVTAPDPGLVETAVLNVLTAANLSGATITIIGPNAASQVTVTVQMDYTILTGNIVPGLGGTLQLSRSAVMRWES
jgi:Flp pilus assembly protein TadG